MRNLSNIEDIRKSSEYQESNPGQLDMKCERYLCAISHYLSIFIFYDGPQNRSGKVAINQETA